MTTITGNTFAVKDQLKALGGRWNADAKGWDVPDDRAERAREIVASAGERTFPASFSRLADGSWGIRGKGLAAGAKVAVRKREGSTSTETVGRVLSTDSEGWQMASIVPTEKPKSAGSAKYVVKGGMVTRNRGWRPCGYPGCSPSYCDECDGEGYRSASGGRRWGR